MRIMRTNKLRWLAFLLPLAIVLLLPGESPDAPLVLAVIGDYGTGAGNAIAVANRVHSWNPDAVLTTGDNNYPDGKAATINKNITIPYGRYITNDLSTNRFWPSLGNHDYHVTNATPYINYFTLPGNERYYDVDYGNVRLWAMDSERMTAAQTAWIETGLEASAACFDIVYFHHPPYSSGKHGSSSKMQLPFDAWGADVVLSGHDHLYERLNVNGMAYFVNGAGGKALYSFRNISPFSVIRFNQTYGAMKIVVEGGHLTAQFITAAGTVIDTYALDKDCP